MGISVTTRPTAGNDAGIQETLCVGVMRIQEERSPGSVTTVSKAASQFAATGEHAPLVSVEPLSDAR